MLNKRYRVIKDGKCLYESNIYAFANFHAERCGGTVEENKQ